MSYASVRSLHSEHSAVPSSIDKVEAWTVDQAAEVLAATFITSDETERAVRGTAVTLDIPLDESIHLEPPHLRPEAVHTVYRRREPLRRDSQRRREALLKGKEGSRRRQRWENDRLLHNPHAQPPLPSDWEIQALYPRHQVPYFLAPLWDAKYAHSKQERQMRFDALKVPINNEDAHRKKLAQELRAKLKKARGAKGLLQDLEQEIRGFMKQWDEKERQLEEEGLMDLHSEDDEVVFVGRNNAINADKSRTKQGEGMEKGKLIFQSLCSDHGASFGRYLVHSIAAYYGLKTWSVTTGDPARREAYVGLHIDPKTRRPSWTRRELPRPLWAVV